MRILHDLMEQLGEDTHEIYFAGKSPIHKKVVELRLADSSPSKFSTGMLKPFTNLFHNFQIIVCPFVRSFVRYVKKFS